MVFGGPRLSALVPPRPSVLPPGAGNEESKKVLKADEQRAKKSEERYVGETVGVEGHLHAATVARDDDGDVASIPIPEPAQ